jgi:hypothetical protein
MLRNFLSWSNAQKTSEAKSKMSVPVPASNIIWMQKRFNQKIDPFLDRVRHYTERCNQAVERARIPEKNDGSPVEEAKWVTSAEASSADIFAKQNEFFDELKQKSGT